MPPIAPGAAQVFPSNVLALMVPVLVKFSDPPAPTTMAAVVFVAPVIPLKATFVADPALPPMLRLATGVVDATTKGAVPVATVLVICPLALMVV